MSTDRYHDDTGAKPPVVRLWVAVFLGYSSLGATLQLLPGWLEARLGSSEAFIAVAIGIAFAATAVCRPLAGWVGDAGASKAVVVTGGLLVVIGSSGQLFSERPGLIIAARLAMGAGEACVFSGALPWVLRGTDVSRRGRVAGWFGMSMWSGLALGPVAAAAVAHQSQRTAWALVLLMGTACAAVAGTTPTSGRARFSGFAWKSLWPPGVGMPALVFGLGAYGYGTISAVLVLYLSHGAGGEQLGLAAFAAAFLLVRVAGSHAVDRFGGGQVLVATLAVEASGLGCLTTLEAPVGIFVGIVLAGSGCSLLFPATVSVALGRVAGGLPGTAVATATSMWDLGILAAGLGAGTLVALASYAAAFGSALLATLLAILAALWLRADRTDDSAEDVAAAAERGGAQYGRAAT